MVVARDGTDTSPARPRTPQAETEPLLSTTGLTVRFGGVVALNRLDVGFLPGEVCGGRNCDRIVVLNLGAMIAEGPPEQVRNDPVVGTAYLG